MEGREGKEEGKDKKEEREGRTENDRKEGKEERSLEAPTRKEERTEGTSPFCRPPVPRLSFPWPPFRRRRSSGPGIFDRVWR